jgi:hypothetical protein
VKDVKGLAGSWAWVDSPDYGKILERDRYHAEIPVVDNTSTVYSYPDYYEFQKQIHG